MIRNDLIKEIHQTVETGGFFKANDFLVEHEAQKDGSNTLVVRYKFEDIFFFKATIPTRRTQIEPEDRYQSAKQVHVIEARMSPGDLAHVEILTLHDRAGLLSGIGVWVRNLRNELQALPLNRAVAQQERQIAEMARNFERLPDEYFSLEQAEQLRRKLQELEQQLKSNIESSTSAKEDLKKRLDALEKDFAELSNQIEALKAKKWFGSFLVRFANWTRDPENRKVLSAGVEVARALLPDGTPEK